jgi:tRNA wybutosine-synthesizing protein 3
MAVQKKRYQQQRQKARNSYHEAQKNNVIDSLVKPILASINKLPQYYTTSSCAGRIVLMQIPQIGDKKQARFLGKWHRVITIDELTDAISLYEKDQLWLIAQSPIFHIGAENLQAADKMVHLGIASGMKHSGIKTIKDQIIVELVSTERVDIPFGKNGHVLVDKKAISFYVSIANDIVNRAHEKLKRLEKMILDMDW